MILFRRFTQKQLLGMVFITLVFLNLIFWSSVVFHEIKTTNLDSSGTFFASDGAPVNYSDRLEFKFGNFSYSIKYNWNDKSNTMQEIGTIKYGLKGEMKIIVNKSLSFGSSLLNELDLDEDIVFNRTYMQSGQAEISALPLPGMFEGFCYYLIYSKKVYCGSAKSISIN